MKSSRGMQLTYLAGLAAQVPLWAGAFLDAKGYHGSLESGSQIAKLVVMDLLPAFGLAVTSTGAAGITGYTIIAYAGRIRRLATAILAVGLVTLLSLMIVVIPTWLLSEQLGVSVHDLLSGALGAALGLKLAWLYNASLFTVPEAGIILVLGCLGLQARVHAAEEAQRLQEQREEERIAREREATAAMIATEDQIENNKGTVAADVLRALRQYSGTWSRTAEIASASGRSHPAVLKELRKRAESGEVSQRPGDGGSGLEWVLAASLVESEAEP